MSAMLQLVYLSALADSALPSCIPQILHMARSRNALNDLTGLLVFDGKRFCQYLEGPRDALLDTIKRIAVDNRHHDFTIKHQGALNTPRYFSGLSMAYGLDADGLCIDRIAACIGPSVIKSLVECIPELDIETSLPSPGVAE